MTPRFSVVPATYVLLMRGHGPETEVLLQLRGATGFMENHWACAAAGHVELGETIYDAARREAAEELGIGLDARALVPLLSMQRTLPGSDDPVEQRVDYFLTARRWTGTPRIMEPDKCRALRWCHLDDLPQPVVPHELRVLAGLRDGTLRPIETFGFGG